VHNKDVENLKKLYEDLAGETYPQYGGNYPIPVSYIGTETLKSGEVDVPVSKEHETDDEDEIGKSSLDKIFDSVKDTIMKIEDKISERKKKEINKDLKESYLINEIGSFLAQNAIAAYKAAEDPTTALKQLGNTELGFKQGEKYSKSLSESNAPMIGDAIYNINNKKMQARITGLYNKEGQIIDTTSISNKVKNTKNKLTKAPTEVKGLYQIEIELKKITDPNDLKTDTKSEFIFGTRINPKTDEEIKEIITIKYYNSIDDRGNPISAKYTGTSTKSTIKNLSDWYFIPDAKKTTPTAEPYVPKNGDIIEYNGIKYQKQGIGWAPETKVGSGKFGGRFADKATVAEIEKALLKYRRP